MDCTGCEGDNDPGIVSSKPSSYSEHSSQANEKVPDETDGRREREEEQESRELIHRLLTLESEELGSRPQVGDACVENVSQGVGESSMGGVFHVRWFSV